MYHLILIPLITVIITQIIKAIIDGLKRQFSWQDFFSYGGMPSSHTSFCVSLCFAVGYFEGLQTAAFAVAAVFTILTVRDALGIRQELGRHAKQINFHTSQLPANASQQLSHLPERLGHTSLQILVGCVLGVIIPIIYILLV